MTATMGADSRLDMLTLRLAELRTERDAVLTELASNKSGDAADRATNVDATVRFAQLEQRIYDVELQLLDTRPAVASDGTVAVGDVVTLDLGDGPETLLLGSVEQGGGGLDVVTPGSPLGAAIKGASVGSTVSYRIRSTTFDVTIIAVS